jgi:hypothetical protein
MVVSEARIDSWNPAVPLKLAPLVRLDDDQLFDFCQLNRDLRIERDAEGVLLLMGRARRQRHRLRFVRWLHPAQWRDALAGCRLGPP